MKKGLARLIFLVVFLIPVAWYLILQLFGSNNFALEQLDQIPVECGQYNEIVIISSDDSLSVVETNYMNRVVYAAEKRKAKLDYRSRSFFDCINQSDADLVLIDEKGLWGIYELSRDGVDELLTELDILTIQKSYGEGTSR